MPPSPQSPHTLAELAAAMQALKAEKERAAVAKRQALRRIRDRDHQAHTRWQDMLAFGVLVVALVGADFRWVPHLLTRFELDADAEELEDELGT